MKKEMEVRMVMDLNRIFGYEFEINDGEVKKMLTPQEAQQQMIILTIK